MRCLVAALTTRAPRCAEGRCKVKANVKRKMAEKSFIALLLLCCVFGFGGRILLKLLLYY